MNPTLAGIIALILWPISPLLVIGTGGAPPFLIAAVSTGIAVLLCLVRLKVRGDDVVSMARQSLAAYVLVTLGMGGYIVLWFFGFKNAPPFEANTLNYLWPILLVLFSHLLAGERFSAWALLGLVAGFSGVVLLFSQVGGSGFDAIYLWGYLSALAGAVVWALYSTMTRYVQFPNGALAFLMMPTAVICLICHFLLEQPYVPTLGEWCFLFALGFTRISFVFWDYAMKHGQLMALGSLSYFVPVVSTGLLTIFGFIPRNEMILISAFLVLAGCLLANFPKIRALLRFDKS